MDDKVAALIYPFPENRAIQVLVPLLSVDTGRVPRVCTCDHVVKCKLLLPKPLPTLVTDSVAVNNRRTAPAPAGVREEVT